MRGLIPVLWIEFDDPKLDCLSDFTGYCSIDLQVPPALLEWRRFFAFVIARTARSIGYVWATKLCKNTYGLYVFDLRDIRRGARPYDPLQWRGGRIAKPIVAKLIHPTSCRLPPPRQNTRDVRFDNVYARF